MSDIKQLAIKVMTTWSGCRDKTGNVDLPTAEQALGEEVALFAAINEQNVELAAIRAENADLKQKLAAEEALSVTRILISVDEYSDNYAKSVEEVSELLGELGGEIEDWELGIKQHATIESLNLRVARLVDTGNRYIDEVNNEDQTLAEYTKRKHELVEALSLESDNQWLREKQAEALEDANRWVGNQWLPTAWQVMCELNHRISELRNPSPESDIDQATRQT